MEKIEIAYYNLLNRWSQCFVLKIYGLWKHCPHEHFEMNYYTVEWGCKRMIPPHHHQIQMFQKWTFLKTHMEVRCLCLCRCFAAAGNAAAWLAALISLSASRNCLPIRSKALACWAGWDRQSEQWHLPCEEWRTGRRSSWRWITSLKPSARK